MAKHRITQTTHTIARGLEAKLQRGPPNGAPNRGEVGSDGDFRLCLWNGWSSQVLST